MSYYFAIVGAQDNPLFGYEFGTSKQGGDGQSRFTDQLRHLNQFILHSSLDIAEEVQWSTGQMSVFPSLLYLATLESALPRRSPGRTDWSAIYASSTWERQRRSLAMSVR